VAFLVCRGIGLETNNAAADYISLYSGDQKTLAGSLSAIQQTSGRILDDLLPPERVIDSQTRAAGDEGKGAEGLSRHGDSRIADRQVNLQVCLASLPVYLAAWGMPPASRNGLFEAQRVGWVHRGGAPGRNQGRTQGRRSQQQRRGADHDGVCGFHAEQLRLHQAS
jgi:hypothetical protein